MGSEEALAALRQFIDERDWQQFHTAETLAKSISIESGELLECFQWSVSADPESVRSELADVLTYCYLLADKLGSTPEQLILEKLSVTQNKYPVEKSRGMSTKYDQL